MQLGRETGFNSEYSKNKWAFIAKEQVGGVDGKLLRGHIKGRGNSC